MTHVQLEHRGDGIPLPSGDHTIGRGLRCRLRFNDASVSRAHLRLEVRGSLVTAVDLGSTNGTFINGAPLQGSAELRHGDVIRIGERELRLTITDEAGSDVEDETQTRRGHSWPGADDQRSVTPVGGIGLAAGLLGGLELPAERTCPRCRGRVAIEESICRACGYEWPEGRPTSVTRQIRIRREERRREPRLAVEIPVLYVSEWLSLDAVARDLSRSGVFIASELLDDLSTRCSVTLLADGWQAMTFDGVVRRVVQAQTGEGGHPPGMGIEFSGLDGASRAALERLLERAKRG